MTEQNVHNAITQLPLKALLVRIMWFVLFMMGVGSMFSPLLRIFF